MKVFVIKSDVKIEQSIHWKTSWRKEDCIIWIWIFNQKTDKSSKVGKGVGRPKKKKSFKSGLSSNFNWWRKRCCN
ncbi:hypothetical protein [Mycoplasmopsis felis]|uniref:hypothetical protein n=1 Tax=Mycoplasmopsis felis TaxID=33923 RepID=UPI002AFFF1F3|nr:hypothetical protein [Mycoplasmopsis felis]WQQ02934.1 hypothetical protein RRG38_02145 [Mycoplasmopsis felis]